MAYPIQATASLSAGESASVVTFRPAAAGLVTVTAICEGDLSALSQQPKGGTEPLQPNGKPEPPANLEVRIQAVPPGSQTPAINVKKRQLDPEKDPTVIVWGSGPALDTQLSGDWTVTITNTGNVPVKGTVTVRYQTVPGNLGKIDHIIVLMMENRS
ncbi:MAG: hypothetical protein JO266_05065, partial [Acidobacteria bacterium]|nr:hypothetical protein [Acidobacteriota bacterium]